MLSPGTHVGPYEVLDHLGSGGMGEVYRARHTKLSRDVALKVLPEAFASDPERLARFEREAQALAALNHPNIAQIYGLEAIDPGESGQPSGGPPGGSAEGDAVSGQGRAPAPAIAMELVEGPTLEDRIATSGVQAVSSTEEALDIARQIVAALDAAHGAGIVHRDLKPANIKVKADGTVKVLDFGLAKALGDRGGNGQGSGSGPTVAPTMTSPTMTEMGMVLGTAGYMAPEQARGQAVDRRADIWAFGVVLYEMLTGKRLFAGETVSDTVAAILTREPDWTVVPVGLRRLLGKCLEKDPRDRLRDIGDAWMLVEEPTAATAVPPATRSVLAWAAAALVLGVIAGALGASFMERAPEPTPVSFFESPPEGGRFVQAPLPSPDGRHLAMLVSDPAARRKIWVRSLGAAQARPLDGTEGASVVFWSPDSRELAFHASGELRRITFDGSENRLISALTVSAGVWSAAGDLVVSASGRGLVAVSATGGNLRPLLNEAGVEYRHLDLVPGGSTLVIHQFGGESGIHAYDLARAERRLLVPGANSDVRCVGPDLFVYEQDRVLLAQRFDPADMSLVGDPFPIARDVGPEGFAGSAAGALSFVRGATGNSRLVWIDRQGQVMGAAAPEGLYQEVYVSPRGNWILFVESDPVTGNLDLWVQDMAQNTPNRFTTDPDTDHLAAFSPDDEEVVWEGHTGGVLNLMRRPSDGSAPATIVRPWSRPGGPSDWSPDGRFILYASNDGATRYNLWAVPLDGDGEAVPLIESEFNERWGRFSPDGRWLAYTSDRSGRTEIYLQRLDGTSLIGGPQRVSNGGGNWPLWRRDGRELFFRSDEKLMVADMRLDTDQPAGTPRELFVIGRPRDAYNAYGVTPDGQRFLAIVPEDTAVAGPATIVLDWAAGLEERR